ncbi:GvpL/GvpF family gas vesicle protein [Labedaea rhizosphaerae]|uniref:GvpL/GvpF family gas vesicle protein n=1 Tax=Labedaea rhizosphaerae TaxID=598644 RepID=UPI001FB79569|nr:GvpL/GvpF family gas vesicle protein [Labedaea rhizosphaerae]
MAEKTETVVYVYGIVPADVEIDSEARGVGDPPAKVTTVRSGDIAALVSEIDPDRPLGTPEDLATHARLLDGAASEVPVLPLRFGAVVSNVDAVSEELLEANREGFLEALQQLEGKAEYIVKGRYVEKAILNEILEENPALAELRESIKGKSEDATRNERIALGEKIGQAIAAKREADSRRMAEALASLDVQLSPRDVTEEQQAVHLACLAETERQDELESVVDELAAEWEGRVEIRLLGPLAAYDFVVTEQAGA